VRQSPRLAYRPRLESLEDRALPNNFFHLGHGHPDLPGVGDLFGPATVGDSGDQERDNPGVAPLQSNPYGASYAQWSARWWQYALSVPTSQSPFLDQTGANFAAGQSGNVWFLSGAFVFTPGPGEPPPINPNLAQVDRHVTLPAGKALFFPVLNAEWDNLVPGGPNTTYTVDQLRQLAKAGMDGAENMQVQVDGHSIKNVPSYRVQSPVFSYTLPDDNITSFASGVNVPGQTVSPAVGDGVYLMLRPLSVGKHVIHFSGDFGQGNFALDITYHITVTPGKGKD
jgi:hypothetical protein